MIDFIKYQKIYFLLSALVIIPGVYALLNWGLRPSIDFTGGTLLEVHIPAPDSLPRLRELTEEQGVPVNTGQTSGEQNYLLRLPPLEEGKKQVLLAAYRQEWSVVEEVRYETVGPVLGAELLRKTLVAIILATGTILLYVAYRFQDRLYGISAILAMLHDSLILLGSFSLLGHFWGVEVDTLFVTAVLTVLSFSVHDTVVVYDRIRELSRHYRSADFSEVVNRAINETLVRSLNNSLTIIFMLLALVLLGGETIRYFAIALLIGTVAGTYSSTFTAAPLLVVGHRFLAKRRQK